jgi:hypothetical protein
MLSTDWTNPLCAHRVVVRETAIADEPPSHYVDAFAVRRRPGDSRALETIARDTFERAPALARATFETAFAVLGFRLGPRNGPGHIGGWRITRSEPDLVEIAVDGSRASGRIVVREVDGVVTATTFLSTHHPLAALAWIGLAPAHRRIARLLLDRGARG